MSSDVTAIDELAIYCTLTHSLNQKCRFWLNGICCVEQNSVDNIILLTYFTHESINRKNQQCARVIWQTGQQEFNSNEISSREIRV